MEVIYQPEPVDVLCGRGENSFRHVGNQYFRQLILENASDYEMAETKGQKTQLVFLVAYSIVERGGRFLIRSDDGKSWRDGGLKQGKLKAGHAFRDAARGRFQRLERTTRSRAQGKREGEIEANEQARSTQTNDIPMEKVASSSLSLSPMLSSIEPSKGWKTARMDPELATEVKNLLHLSESHGAITSKEKALSQTTRKTEAKMGEEMIGASEQTRDNETSDSDVKKAAL